MGRRLFRGLRRSWLRLRAGGVPALVYSPRYQQGLWGVPLDPLRGEKILAALDEAGLLSRHALSEPRPASVQNLLRVHTARYLRSLEEGEPLGRILGAPVSSRDAEAVLELQRLMVGGTIQATRLAIRAGGVAVHLGGGFHHALPDAGMGFCVFNDVAVAITRLRARGYREPILVADLDLHDGNGTRAAFADDPTVHTFSIHNEDWGHTEAIASTSIALGAEVDDARYLAALHDALPRVFASFRPGLVFYLAGADVAHDDPIGNWRLSDEGIQVRDRLVSELAHPRPLVVVLAGGYGRQAWRHSARYLLRLASGRPLEPPDEEELTLARFRRLSAVLHETGEASGDRAFSLTEEDLAALRPAYASSRFLEFFSRQAVELQLEGFGILPQLRGKGFRRLRVELVASDGIADTLKVFCEDEPAGDLLIELRVHRSRSAIPGFEVLAIEWLLLQNPRAAFSPRRPRLPEQQHPGLGLLKDVLGWLVLVCEEHALDGIVFVAEHYHIAIQSRRLVRLLRPEEEARLRTLQAVLEGLSLAEAARALSEGRVLGGADGRPVAWKPVSCVVPVSAALREQVSGAAYDEAAARAAEGLVLRLRGREPAANPAR